MPRLLVTGFGPFPGVRVNPSDRVARRIAAAPRWRFLGVEAQALVLETTYAALDRDFLPALRALRPDVVLMIGVAGRAKRVRVERQAVNRASRLFPDASGAKLRSLTLRPGPLYRPSTGAPRRALARLKGSSVKAALSHNAGRYLCNAAYYAALGEPAPALFLHIPRAPKARPRRPMRRTRLEWHDELAAAFAGLAAGLLAQARLSRSQA